MKYDFDKVIQRKGTASLKWDYLGRFYEGEDLIPMWVADMDFECHPKIGEALVKRAKHNLYGYTVRHDEYYSALMNWMRKRNDWEIKKDWIIYTPGVFPAINFAINAFTRPGDEIIIQPPIYHPFFSAVTSNQRKLIENNLILTDEGYKMDFEDLKKKITKNTKMIIFCSPHNPVGRVWTQKELKELGELCVQNNILIISDEIHSDLIYPGYKHTCIACLSKDIENITITLTAPSKTFNIAGLHTASAIIPNKELREGFNEFIQRLGLSMSGVFGIEAHTAAYNYGEEWLEELMEYIEKNYNYMEKFLKDKMPKIKPIKPQGTYLVWLDLRDLGLTPEEIKEFLLKRARLALNHGNVFGTPGKGFQRINIGTRLAILKQALEGLYEGYQENGF